MGVFMRKIRISLPMIRIKNNGVKTKTTNFRCEVWGFLKSNVGYANEGFPMIKVKIVVVRGK